MKQKIKQIIEENNIIVRQPNRFVADKSVNMKDLFIEVFKEVDKTFKEYKHLPEYDEVIEWLKDTKGKGLLMTGSLGRGKSVILYGVIPVIFRLLYNRKITTISAKNLIEPDKHIVSIDDIGTEEIKNNFGNKIDAVSNAICYCEDYMKPLLMTSNLTNEQRIERYGLRAIDRISRLCQVVVFKGKSLR